MSKILLDTNVVLDYLSASRPEHLQSVDMFEALFTLDHEPVISVSTIKDTYYIMCRMYKREDIVRERLHMLLDVVRLEELTIPVVERAFTSDEPDLEDGIIRATAELYGAQAIITRDESAFLNSSVQKMTPREFCLSCA